MLSLIKYGKIDIMTPFAILMGMIFSIPIFMLIFFLYVVLFEKIKNHLLIWTLVSPIIVVSLWLILELLVSNYNVEASFSRLILVFMCSSISAITFFVGTKTIGKG